MQPGFQYIKQHIDHSLIVHGMPNGTFSDIIKSPDLFKKERIRFLDDLKIYSGMYTYSTRPPDWNGILFQ